MATRATATPKSTTRQPGAAAPAKPISTRSPAAPAAAVAATAKATTASSAPTPPSQAAPKKAAQPAKVAMPAMAARPDKRVKPDKQEEPSKPAKPAKPAKLKLVRDSFAMPAAEYALLAEVKQRLLLLGRAAKKSEVLRAGVVALHGVADDKLLAALAALPAIKTGRPKSS